MTVPRIEERTLYPPLISYLDSIGFKAVGETKVIKKHPDILFRTDSISFVIEVKIGKPEVGLEAVAQASDYARKLGTQNIIILIYPEKYRNQIILDPKIVSKVALNEKITALVLTEYWTESLDIEPYKLFEQLKQRIHLKEIKVDFRTIVRLIERYVKDLNAIIYQIKTEELISEVVDKLDLFSSIGEIKDKETAKKQVINLASYLLFNQLLFYHIYKRKSGREELPELDEITNVSDLQRYFDRITDIDYQSIYRVNILRHIPNREVVIDTLNEVIKAIKLLRAEHITSDLAGRFFHDLIPYEVRKVLAAFYTHPVAAEILAGLTIDSWDETVIDPACGSGTLLVAAYKRKMDLYRKLYGYRDIERIHRQFIEHDLTGIDIMPFAAHISTINLTMQNIEYETNIVRIGTKDSLDLVKSLKTPDFNRRGIKISPYTETIQQTLFGITGQKVRKEGAISPEGKGYEFYIKPVNVVIMNPPFTDRHKMPEDYRKKLKLLNLRSICGGAVDLWGYFLALAHYFVKDGGKIGAVIPINIARGKFTKNIRELIFSQYQIKYIVKSIKDIGFSEAAGFRDILLVLEKRNPTSNDITKIIFLKKSIRALSLNEAKHIVNIIKDANSDYSDEFVDVNIIRFRDLIKFKENLMPLLSGHIKESRKMIESFEKVILKKGEDKLINITEDMISVGFITDKKGIADLTFITRPFDRRRVSRAFLILENDNNKEVMAKIKNTGITIKVQKSITKPALRTLTGVKTLDITNNHDYFIIDKFDDFDIVFNLSKWQKGRKFSWNWIKNKIPTLSYVVLAEKINPFSPNTSLISVHMENKFVVPHVFWIFKHIRSKDEGKMLCLYLNSIAFFIQYMRRKSEATGEYAHILKEDLILTKVLDFDTLAENKKRVLLELFEKLKDVEFPSILEQLENRFWARVELDKTILKILGFSNKEINKWLPKVYDALVEELKAMKEVR